MAMIWKVVFMLSLYFGSVFRTGIASRNGLDNLGARIKEIIKEVDDNLAPLKFLDHRIKAQVHESLRPVREMESRLKMMNGQGGTTIACYGNNKNKQLLIHDGVRYKCNGEITNESPYCNGNMVPFELETDADYCYAPSFARSNSNVCLGGSSFIATSYDDVLICEGSSNIRQLTAVEFKNMCGFSGPDDVRYTYYPDSRNRNVVAVASGDAGGTCISVVNGGCVFAGVFPNGASSVVYNQINVPN